MWGEVAASGFAAFCVSKWSWKADQESKGACGNGFLQTTFGPGVLRFAAPARFRILFPALLYPTNTSGQPAQPSWRKWIAYQWLRYKVLWAALALIAVTFGLPTMVVSAALFGLAARYDYWSSSVEFLSVALVLSAGGLHWPWWSLLAAGLVLGTGRETLPFLAILGTVPAIALGAGAAVSHFAVRLVSRPLPEWGQAERDLLYGRPMWNVNLSRLLHPFADPPATWEIGVYIGTAALAAFVAPWLVLALVGTTFLVARIDEPRVLTMLIPFAAQEIVRLAH